MDRREFIKYSFIAGAGSLLLNNPAHLCSALSNPPHAVWVSDGEPEVLLQEALKPLGGMEHFVSKGDVVVVKPNIGWDRAPQLAATTNPQLVAAVIKECYRAGAKKVKLFDNTCNIARRCYRASGIERIAKESGAEVFHLFPHKFKTVALPEGEIIKEWPIYKDYLTADKVINVPIAKHHSLCQVTLGLKNLMGVMGGNRGEIHLNFEKKLIDIVSRLLPTLTIIDAYRILVRNGPVGGNLDDVRLKKTLIASPCTVTADYLALQLFDLKLEMVPYIQEAYRRGLNKFDPDRLTVKYITLKE